MYEAAFLYIDAIPASRGTDQNTRTTKRREYLVACLEQIKHYEHVFLTEIDPADYYVQSFDVWARGSLAALAMARIHLRRDAKDLSAVIRDTINFEEMFERSARAWELACATAKYQGLPLGNNHLFERWAWRLRVFKDSNKHVHDPRHLPRANTQATFPGDDPIMPPDAQLQVRASAQAKEERRRIIQELGEDGTLEDAEALLEAESAPWEPSLPMDEHTAVQCPMS